MARIIIIDNTKYVLPEGMSTTEVQALCGALITLVKIDYEYCYGEDPSQYYPAEGAIVSLGHHTTLTTKEEAKAKASQSRVKYEARQAAEKAAKAAAAAE